MDQLDGARSWQVVQAVRDDYIVNLGDDKGPVAHSIAESAVWQKPQGRTLSFS
jgi:hypothetical protein